MKEVISQRKQKYRKMQNKQVELQSLQKVPVKWFSQSAQASARPVFL
jgi:hypothetical protein